MTNIDSFGRTIDYLRISVTDRCNFRCVYCLPPEGLVLKDRDDLLTFEEIQRVATLFLKMGGRKLRLTGGEPLMRKNVAELVQMLTPLPGLASLGLTTNGTHLEELAESLHQAGLKNINVSLDSVRPSRFAELTGSSQFEKVWRGIEKALTVGLKVKINVVALKGIAEQELVAFGDMAMRLPVEIRFIEFMPLCGTGWHPEWMIALKEIRNFLIDRFDLKPLPRRSEVAQSYSLPNGKGRLGFIASLSEPFCDACSRLRLTADGKLRPCLFSNLEFDLKQKLRGGWSDEDVMETLREVIWQKPAGHGISLPIRDGRELPRIRFVGG